MGLGASRWLNLNSCISVVYIVLYGTWCFTMAELEQTVVLVKCILCCMGLGASRWLNLNSCISVVYIVLYGTWCFTMAELEQLY